MVAELMAWRTPLTGINFISPFFFIIESDADPTAARNRNRRQVQVSVRENSTKPEQGSGRALITEDVHRAAMSTFPNALRFRTWLRGVDLNLLLRIAKINLLKLFLCKFEHCIKLRLGRCELIKCILHRLERGYEIVFLYSRDQFIGVNLLDFHEKPSALKIQLSASSAWA
jgi:hypothetical protein